MKGLIFDFDGTLVDSFEDIAVSVNNVLIELNKPVLPLKVIYSYIGDGLSHLLIKAMNIEDKVFINKAKEIFRTHYSKNLLNKTVLYPGVRRTLAKLFKNHQLFILSNKPFEFVEPMTEQLKIKKYFLDIIAPPVFEPLKPDPAGILMIAQKYGLPLKEMVIIGDHFSDMEAGSSAGIRTIFCQFGRGRESDFVRPDIIIHRFADLLKYV